MIHGSLQRRRFIANALLASAILASAVLLIDPPTQSGIYPTCPIRDFFGIDCPGCGATRALAALLRGRILDALRLNALFVALFPIAMAGAALTYRRAISHKTFIWPSPPAPALYATLAAAFLFSIARNL